MGGAFTAGRPRLRLQAGQLVGLLHGHPQRLELRHELVDVVAEHLGVTRADGHLDGAGDQLVEAGVEQAQAVTALLGERRQPVGRRQLGLQRLDRRRLRAGRRTSPAASSSASSAAAPCGVDLPEGGDDLVAALGDPPRLVDALVEPRRQVGEPLAQRAVGDRGDDLVEATLGILGALGIAAPWLAEGVRLRGGGIRPDGGEHPPTPRQRADPGGGDERSTGEDRHGRAGTGEHDPARRHDRLATFGVKNLSRKRASAPLERVAELRNWRSRR